MEKFKCTIYKNIYEPLFDIPNEWIDGKVKYKFDDVDEFTLKIPKKLPNNKLNLKFKKIKSGMFAKILKHNGKEDLFYLTSNQSTYSRYNENYETFNCYQYQKKLDHIPIDLSGGIYQLSNTVDKINSPDKGLMEYITDKCGYSLGYIDKKCAYGMNETEEYISNTINVSQVNNVKVGSIIFNINVNFSSIKNDYGKTPIYVDVLFEEVKTTDGNDYGDVFNVFDVPFSKDIRHIKAEYYDGTGNRYSIKYTFLFEDGTTKEIIKNFVNADGKTLTFKSITIKHTNGKRVKKETIKFRSFSDTSTNIYDLLKSIEELYDCYVIFDNINMTISLYDKESYGEDKAVELNLDSNCLNVTTKEKDEDEVCITGLQVKGQEYNGKQISIADYNTFGGDIIYNYDYYIKNELIPQFCIDELDNYQKQLVKYRQTNTELVDKASDIAEVLVTLDTTVSELQQRISYYNQLLSTYISAKTSTENQLRIAEEIKQYEKDLNDTIAKRDSLQKQYDKLNDITSNNYNNIKRENIVDDNGNKIFSDKTLKILRSIDKIKTVNDSYFVTDYGLYDYYKKQLDDMITANVTFEISVSNINKYLDVDSDNFEIGMLNYLSKELQDYIGEEKVRLMTMEFNPLTNKFENTFTYSNKYTKVDLVSILKKMSSDVKSNTVTLNNYDTVSSSAIESNNFVQDITSNGINLSKIKLVNSNGTVTLDENGFCAKDTNNSDNQIYIDGSTIALTNDSWSTNTTFVTDGSVNADSLKGILSLDNDLSINGAIDNFHIGYSEDKSKVGLFVYDKKEDNKFLRMFIGVDLVNKTDGLYKFKFEVYDESGQLTMSNEGLAQSNDATYNLYISSGEGKEIKLYIPDKTTMIKGTKLKVEIVTRGCMNRLVKQIGTYNIYIDRLNDNENLGYDVYVNGRLLQENVTNNETIIDITNSLNLDSWNKIGFYISGDNGENQDDKMALKVTCIKETMDYYG